MPPSSSSRSAVGSTVAKSASRPTRTTANSASSSTSTRAHNHWSDRLLSVLVPLSVLSFVIPAIVSALLHAFSLPALPHPRHLTGAMVANRPTSRAPAPNPKSTWSGTASYVLRTSSARAPPKTSNSRQDRFHVTRCGAHPNPGVNASNGSAIPPLCELNKSASCPNLGRYARRSGATSSTSRSRNRSGSAYSGTNAADDTRSVCSSASTDDLDAISESTPFLLSPASSSPQVAKPKTIPPSEASAFHSSSAALHRDSAVFPSPTSSLFSSRSTANESTCADTRGSTSSTSAAAPMIAFNPTPFTPAISHKHTNATTTTAPSSLTTTVASSPPTFPLSFPDPPLAPLPMPTTSNAAPTRFQLPTTPIDPQTHLRHLLACSGAAWWATRFAICDILTPRARRQLFLAQDMLIATSTSSTNALGTVCMAVVSEHEAARQALMAQLARSARVERMLPVLDVVMPPAAAHLPSGAVGGVGTGVREAVVVVPLSVMGSVADRVRVRRLAPNEAKALLGVVVAAMAKLARVGVGYRGFKLDYVLINGHIPDTQDLTPVDMLVGGYHAMFDTPLPSSPKSPSTPASSSVNSDVVTPDAARAIADLLTAVGKAMDPTRPM
ncbi:hypothetical protein BCR44DRAFT_1484051 [Catenaria anguillulae PL171]|uniref:Protein kinase domain-containing protein n=1 Tax=Catenaria anguillulae PL171 TaxID=765915 RepID=A0A1Y2HWT6_9FUNG|nr:hypothetical protein BCR44DRAFT_1484051 [Catenaria anguillulae PL171]